jgi:hypothetical protein
MLQDDAGPESPVPLAVMPKDIFDLLKRNESHQRGIGSNHDCNGRTDFYDKTTPKKLQTT